MAAAAAVFAADSAAVITQLRTTGRRRGPHPHAVIAASMVDLAISVTGNIDDGMRRLIDHLRTPSLPAPTREIHNQAIFLADPKDEWAVLRAQPGGQNIATYWTRRRAAITRYHQLAALATGDLARQRTAETAMLCCLRDRAQLDRITDSGLCHGIAGVLHTAWRMAAGAQTSDIATELPRLSARLLTQLRPAPEEAEFLDGTTGIALALHTAGTDTAPLAGWDTCLLLA